MSEITARQAAYIALSNENWSITNLKLQKILYLINMVYVGEHSQKLIKENFYANLMGPIVPALYNELQVFGNRNISFLSNPLDTPNEDHIEFIKKWSSIFNKKSSAELVSITHSHEGAFVKNFDSKLNIGKMISTSDIKDEYDLWNSRNTPKRILK